jgi:hypothetical protein
MAHWFRPEPAKSAPFSVGGDKYHGTLFTEHAQEDDRATKMGRAWASLDNETSFWFTKPSLLNLLRDVGFTSVSEVFRSKSFDEGEDRITLAAIKGVPPRIVMSRDLEQTPEPDWLEASELPFRSCQAASSRSLWRRILSRTIHTLERAS